MSLEQEMKKMEKGLIMRGIFAMGFRFAYRNPETGKISFYEESPEIKGNDIIWKDEGKDFYGKADHAFSESDFDENNICSLGVTLLFEIFDYQSNRKGV